MIYYNFYLDKCEACKKNRSENCHPNWRNEKIRLLQVLLPWKLVTKGSWKKGKKSEFSKDVHAIQIVCHEIFGFPGWQFFFLVLKNGPFWPWLAANKNVLNNGSSLALPRYFRSIPPRLYLLTMQCRILPGEEEQLWSIAWLLPCTAQDRSKCVVVVVHDFKLKITDTYKCRKHMMMCKKLLWAEMQEQQDSDAS